MQSSKSLNSQAYWHQHLHDAQPTILENAGIRASESSFGFHHIAIPNLQQLEQGCKVSSLPLPTVLLLAFARTLARYTSNSSPVFGLFQTGRSSFESSDLLPLLNVTPYLTRSILNISAKEGAEAIQNDLAARVPFEQSYLHNSFSLIGHENGPLFNTFVNIIWSSPSTTPERGEEVLLSPY